MQRSGEGFRCGKNCGDTVADKCKTCAREICAREVGTLSWFKESGREMENEEADVEKLKLAVD